MSSATKEAQRELGSLRTCGPRPKSAACAFYLAARRFQLIKGELTSPPRGALWTTISPFASSYFVVHAGRLSVGGLSDIGGQSKWSLRATVKFG